ncbi:MAG: YqgE/AlgH family protein, partial [Candidatus Electrothrix sp. AUS1_2]|nr:YqgE/AlgH family protein [Candidatus Electrothrix sp. AUS1_2]
INKPNEEISMMEVLLSTNIPLPEGTLPPVYNGGPVEMEAGFILYSADHEIGNSLKITSNIYLSRESKLLEKISKGEGPKDYMFLLGYAGWGPGQLEDELMDNSWLTVPGNLDVLFHTPDERKGPGMEQGLEIYSGVEITGLFPEEKIGNREDTVEE